MLEADGIHGVGRVLDDALDVVSCGPCVWCGLLLAPTPLLPSGGLVLCQSSLSCSGSSCGVGCWWGVVFFFFFLVW